VEGHKTDNLLVKNKKFALKLNWDHHHGLPYNCVIRSTSCKSLLFNLCYNKRKMMQHVMLSVSFYIYLINLKLSYMTTIQTFNIFEVTTM
jgi:hypothetical protein